MTTLVGLDIGGSKTHGARFENGRVVAEATAGSANVQNVSRETAAEALASIFSSLQVRSLNEVVIGSGGIDTRADADALESLVRPHVGDALVKVVHDSRLILAAGGSSTGVAVIAGTGSAAWGINDENRESRFGGWGYLLGDEGSGYWLGREAVRHSLRQMNRREDPDHLSQAMIRSCGVEEPAELIRLFHSPSHGRNFWARQARNVVACADAGHLFSRQLLEQAGKDLAAMATQTANQLGIEGPVVLGGGLGMNVAVLQQSFTRALAAEHIYGVRILEQQPVFGVLALSSRG